MNAHSGPGTGLSDGDTKIAKRSLSLRILVVSGWTEFTIREQGTDRGRTARKGAGPSVGGMVGVGSVVESQGGDARGRAEREQCWEAAHGVLGWDTEGPSLG